eukprot:Hpha_TRINITY_DN14862_c0_g2::TRINITY_DN14862_c0_g2_i1::g.170408::m.170408
MDTSGDLSISEFVVAHAVNNVIVLVVLGVFDVIFARKSRGRWFFVHSFANLLVCITAMRSMFGVLSDPINAVNVKVFHDTSLFGDASVWPLTIVNSVHLYHMVAFRDLSAADYFHHLLFIPTIGLTGQMCAWGALGNWQAFFISGLPGGVDYFMLYLQKEAKLEKMQEKRYNANLNIWCRMPGILVATILAYAGLLDGRYHGPMWALIMQLVLPPYNALYYAKQAVANYSVHYMLHHLNMDDVIKKRIRERTSLSTGEQILQWDFQAPQRGS